MDDEAPGKGVDTGDPRYGQTARVFISRIRHDLFAESHVGGLVTDREFRDSYSRMAGLDGQFRLSATDRLFFIAFQSFHRDLQGLEQQGPAWGVNYRHTGRHLGATIFSGSIDPDFRTDTGLVRRVDTRRSFTNLNYRWWPERGLINWGPRFNYERNYNFAGVLDDEIIGSGLDFAFVRNVRVGAGAERARERYRDVDFWKWRYSTPFNVATSRRITVGGEASWGDQIRFSATPFLGRGGTSTIFANLRPFSRLQSQIDLTFSRLVDPRTDAEVFDVRVVRGLTTYRLSERLLFRNITEGARCSQAQDAAPPACMAAISSRFGP